MTLDNRWKFPQGKSPEHLYDCLFTLIRELRKGATADAAGFGAFSAHRNGSDQSVTPFDDNVIVFTHELFDPDSAFDIANNRFLPTVAGVYQISVVATSGDVVFTEILVNGALVAGGSGGVTGGEGRSVATALVELNGTSDYVQGAVFPFDSTISGVLTDTYMCGHLVRAA